jgi:hypothetical protein
MCLHVREIATPAALDLGGAFAHEGKPRWHMRAPIRQRIPLPVGDERGIQPRKGAEQDRGQVTPTAGALPVKLRQAEHSLIPGICRDA